MSHRFTLPALALAFGGYLLASAAWGQHHDHANDHKGDREAEGGAATVGIACKERRKQRDREKNKALPHH